MLLKLNQYICTCIYENIKSKDVFFIHAFVYLPQSNIIQMTWEKYPLIMVLTNNISIESLDCNR